LLPQVSFYEFCGRREPQERSVAFGKLACGLRGLCVALGSQQGARRQPCTGNAQALKKRTALDDTLPMTLNIVFRRSDLRQMSVSRTPQSMEKSLLSWLLSNSFCL
jgi:hypothetical protein